MFVSGELFGEVNGYILTVFMCNLSFTSRLINDYPISLFICLSYLSPTMVDNLFKIISIIT